MRVSASSRAILLAGVLAAALCAIVAIGTPVAAVPAEGTKAAADAGAAPSVPGMTPWGAVITGLMMLLSSSYALYGYGGRGVVTREPTVTEAQAEAPAATRKPARERRPHPELPRGHRAEPRQALLRARNVPRHSHTATSRSKKRRLGAGCRGPLRKT